jgi:hypothetical protein
VHSGVNQTCSKQSSASCWKPSLCLKLLAWSNQGICELIQNRLFLGIVQASESQLVGATNTRWMMLLASYQNSTVPKTPLNNMLSRLLTKIYMHICVMLEKVGRQVGEWSQAANRPYQNQKRIHHRKNDLIRLLSGLLWTVRGFDIISG